MTTRIFDALRFTRRQILCWSAAAAAAAAVPPLMAAESEKPAAPQKPRVAVVYFTKTRNTESLAEAAAAACGGKLFRVEVIDPYPEAYRETTEIVKDELSRGFVREIKPLSINPADFDVFILCTPTWWHHVAKPLEKWIRSTDLFGKQVLTANTHGGGGTMHTREDFEAMLPGSRLGTHLTHYGSASRGESDVMDWLRENGLI